MTARGPLRLPGSTPRGPLLTPYEAARYLQVPDTTLNRWARRGLIPSVKTLGGHRRYRLTDLEQARLKMTGAER